MSYYKLTNQKLQTYSSFQWELGKWYRIPNEDRGAGLCTKGWFHCYNHPLLAVLLNPIHANIQDPRLFKVNVRGSKVTDSGLKFGFSMMRLVEEIPIPKITLTQKAAFAILCASIKLTERSIKYWQKQSAVF